MKKLFAFVSVVAALAMTSCSSVKPVAVTSNPVGTKVGTAKEVKVIGLFPFKGDHGINAAAKNGGITKISHVDVEDFNVLGGLFTKTTTRVYGE